ncbi:site-2 protease family protein [Ruminococcaceae bacterium OttesenSCG-928-L11]|nr:site-2 protease family protein [Ruminococcaceae bacterium OttesenSCG-928-L11]
MTTNIWTLVARVIVLLLTLPFHESAHALAADKLGDPTPRSEGRISLNPFRHLSFVGTMALLLLGFGWAKPVGIDSRYFKKPRRDMALVALAGPMANVLLAFVWYCIYKVAIYTSFLADVATTPFMDNAFTVISMIILINIQLAVFNLLPIPPLDGSKILGFFLPAKIQYYMLRYERYIMLLVFALLYLNVLNKPISFLSNGLLTALDFLTRPIDLLFRAL